LRGEPQPLASQQVRWVRPEQLGEYPFPAANAQIIAALLGATTSFVAAS
jgi:A/G-specific adenine glycosylase